LFFLMIKKIKTLKYIILVNHSKLKEAVSSEVRILK